MTELTPTQEVNSRAERFEKENTPWHLRYHRMYDLALSLAVRLENPLREADELFTRRVGYWQERAEKAEQRVAGLEKDAARKGRVVELADELCTAIESSGCDIGGSRPVDEIIKDLGPSVYAALFPARGEQETEGGAK